MTITEAIPQRCSLNKVSCKSVVNLQDSFNRSVVIYSRNINLKILKKEK